MPLPVVYLPGAALCSCVDLAALLGHRRGTAMTSSDDGTVRVWDMWELQQKTVIKPSLARPGRVAVTACAYSTDGRLIGAGLMDGMLQVWDVRGEFVAETAVLSRARVLPTAMPRHGFRWERDGAEGVPPGAPVRRYL